MDFKESGFVFYLPLNPSFSVPIQYVQLYLQLFGYDAVFACNFTSVHHHHEFKMINVIELKCNQQRGRTDGAVKDGHQGGNGGSKGGEEDVLAGLL